MVRGRRPRRLGPSDARRAPRSRKALTATHVGPLVDVLPGPDDPPPSVLFCGINPGRTALVDGLYFSRAANRFWPVLHEAGFTPHRFRPEEQFALPRIGIGITSLVARPTSRAEELSTDELRAGVPRLAGTAQRFQARWVGFLGITAFRAAFRLPRAGFGPQDLAVGGARMWVLPNPSGLNRGWSLDRLVAEYARLRAAVSPTASGPPVVPGSSSCPPASSESPDRP